MTTKCPRKLLAYYLSDKLDVDDQLIFFAHLDTCPECWDEVYNAVKAQHPHYYKTKSRLKMSDKEIKQFEHKERAIEVA
jgi:anti-sigma factor RsiW